MDASPLRIGIAGLGTVGGGVVKILQKHHNLLARRVGRPIEVACVCARDRNRHREVVLSAYEWRDDPLSMVQDESIDTVVELIGGESGIALDLVKGALEVGKSVVTANKAMLAIHGDMLADIADRRGGTLMYEASVAGGIPIIKTFREGLAANEIQNVCGILNGTSNYILTEMRNTGRDFEEVLKDAQTLGYAEADPAFDIDGIDAAHKLCLLSALAFGHKPDFERVTITGITNVTAHDITLAEELGYRIKLLAIARKINGHVAQFVGPCLVPATSAMAAVDGVFNAVLAEGDFVSTGLAIGLGAGEGPTASAVVSDLVDLARGCQLPVFGIPAKDLTRAQWLDSGALESHYYMHVVVLDHPGVLADISAILRDHHISVEAVLQRGRDPGNPVSIVMTTHSAVQREVQQACDKIAALGATVRRPCVMRIENV